MSKVTLEAELRLGLRCPESKFYFFTLYCFFIYIIIVFVQIGVYENSVS